MTKRGSSILATLDAAFARIVAHGRLWRVLAGAALILVGATTLLTLLGLNTGGLIVRWTEFLQRAVGVGVFPLCLLMIGAGLLALSQASFRPTRRTWTRIIAGEIAFFSFLALVHSLVFGADPYQLALAGGGGGASGWVLAELLWRALGAQGSDGVTLLRLLSTLIWFALFAFSAFVVAAPLLQTTERAKAQPAAGTGASSTTATAQRSLRPEPNAENAPPSRPMRGEQLPLPDLAARPSDVRQSPKPAPASPSIKSEAVIVKDGERAADGAAKSKAAKPKPPVPRPDTLPPLSLLRASKQTGAARSDADARRQAEIIETTLAHFGLSGKVVEIRRGPTVTQFGIEPGYVDRGAQHRDKAAQKIRAAVAGALYDAILVEPSVDRTTAVVEVPAALVDAREAGFKALLKSLLGDLDLSTNYAEGEQRSGLAYFEIGADTERKLKIKVGQLSALRRELAGRLMERLFRFDDFAESDQLTERLKVMFPAGIGEAIALKDALEDVIADLGLAGGVIMGKKASQAVIEWQKQAQKVRVGAIAALQNDLALALAAPSIRIEAPIPGRGLIGIEVPNSSIGEVDLRSIMEGEAFRKLAEKSSLAIALGRDVSGAAIVADLARMPHLLIAGTTGSGKSVCISAITTCLAMNNRPEDLKLVMIDPKMVELSRFAGLPHIIGKPESDIDRIPAVLRWVTREMDARYKKFAEIGARNLQEYNQAMERRREEPLPRIVVLIDELADLMLQSPIETEKTICRLAQMARATGIHLVVATQRPSVDVVTGLIKANFPARISFAVASATDSRVILDQVGAESLLGRGDMLFLNPEHGSPVRLQGCYVSEREIEAVIGWWKKQIAMEKSEVGNRESEEEYVAHRKPELETPWETVVAEIAAERFQQMGSAKGGRGSADDDGDDDLLQRAMEIIRTSGNVSISLLQRKLRIGYPRAARLMEELQEMGYVSGPSRQAGKGRDVTMQDE
ncbi:MAG: DNA translocase FtsK [Anaerolineae bacterium]|nr:DNA translocase FtsK [Candidatus Roseilinea sp.]MDW8450160.1 DNA translocase FtsK [Anaerolineae bacterium]